MDTELRDRWSERAHRRTSAAGLRSGAVRSAVIEYLAHEGQCLRSAQDVIASLRSDNRGSPASVYRVLDELFELGVLSRHEGVDGVARYEIVDPEHHHHHLVDEATGAVHPFTDDELERAIEAAAARAGLELTGHDIVLRGRLAASAREPAPGRPAS